MTEYSIVSVDIDGRCTIDEGTDLSSIATSGNELFSDGMAGIALPTLSIFYEENRRVFRNVCGNYEFKLFKNVKGINKIKDGCLSPFKTKDESLVLKKIIN